MSVPVQIPLKRIAAPALTAAPTGILQRKCACGGTAGAGGECADCKKKKKTLQRFPTAQAAPTGVPSVVHEVLRSPGQPLDAGTRAALEPRFGHDFGKVRIHTDAKAGKSAQSVNAAAYTVGNHVAFAPGNYLPETKAGRWLLAHELSHVVQQGGAGSGEAGSRLEVGPQGGQLEQDASRLADAAMGRQGRGVAQSTASRAGAVLQRQTPQEWDESYYHPDKTIKSHVHVPYEEFKAEIGELRPTTQGGLESNPGRWDKAASQAMSSYVQGGHLGSPAPPEITFDMLKSIYPDMAADTSKDPAKEAQAKKYLASLNRAFKAMKIDTVEAQANYLSHAFVESDQFRQFTETQGSMDDQGRPIMTKDSSGNLVPNPKAGPAQRWKDDPEQVKLNVSYISTTYPVDKDVNPQGRASFIGRGPVQVTHRSEYTEVIALLEKAAHRYEIEAAIDVGTAGSIARFLREKAAEMKSGQTGNPLPSFVSKLLADLGLDASFSLPDKVEQAAAFFAKLAATDVKEAGANAQACRKAATAIKADPRQAANPEYTFLFSAAYMKMRGGDVRVAQARQPDLSKKDTPGLAASWTGADLASNWVAGARQTEAPQVKALKTKGETYDRAYRVLCRASKPCLEAAPKAFQDSP